MTKEIFSNKILTLWSMGMYWMESRLSSNKITTLWTILLLFQCTKKFSSMLRKIPKFKKSPLKTIEFHTEIHSISTLYSNKLSWNSSMMTISNKKRKCKTIPMKSLWLFLHNLIERISSNSLWIRLVNCKNIVESSFNYKN